MHQRHVDITVTKVIIITSQVIKVIMDTTDIKVIKFIHTTDITVIKTILDIAVINAIIHITDIRVIKATRELTLSR